jgi:hypothetical protein
MTPEERNLIIEMFDRLSALEDAQRDPEAERLIRDGLRQAPNAAYTLVQTVLVQDEALKQADVRIRELEGTAQAPGGGSFLDNMRETVLGRGQGRSSVPSVRPGGGVSSVWNTGGAHAMPTGPAPAPGPAPSPTGGSFLGTAAAAAAGMIGGSLLMGGISRAMGGQQQGGQRAFDQPTGGSGASPWGGGGGDLARQAGLDDIGRAPSSRSGDSGSRSFGLIDDSGGEEPQNEQGAGNYDDSGGDDGGGGDEE